jgi:hypothetical protein
MRSISAWYITGLTFFARILDATDSHNAIHELIYDGVGIMRQFAHEYSVATQQSDKIDTQVQFCLS